MYQIPKDKVVECLHELADEVYQRSVWLASSGPEISSFSEAVCGLFNDTGLIDALEKPSHPVFNADIDESLRHLNNAVTKAGHLFQSMSPALVLGDPAMQDIRSTAAKILAQIDQAGTT